MEEGSRAALIAQFHALWDGFPGMARLVSSRHEILAANEAARRKGYVPGAICAQIVTPTMHRGCLLARTLRTGEGQYDMPNEHTLRGWVPLADDPDVVVHFSLTLPPPAAGDK